MEAALSFNNLWKKHIALPQDHGSWVFLLSPLIIGSFAGGRFLPASAVMVVGAMAAFLVRQPLTIVVKIMSGRRNRRDLPAAIFWVIGYGLVGVTALAGLLYLGYAFILYLALPGILVFAWHLYLVSQRAERRQMGIELAATGVLALAAPAGYWIGTGEAGQAGWLLWGLIWFQSAASIVHAYMRLEQRDAKEVEPLGARLKDFRSLTFRAVLYTSFNAVVVAGLALLRVLPPLLFLSYLLQWIETLWCAANPAIGKKPTAIGIRQLIVSTLFTILFIITWAAG